MARLGAGSARLAQAVVPDPFVIAILLAGAALLTGALLGRVGPLALASAFSTGMLEPGLLAFGFEMALILVTGHALAAAPAVTRGLAQLAARPRSTGAAAAMVAAVAMALGLLNWGLGLVGGAFLAREVGQAFARRGQPLNYPLVGAAGYTGLLVWHGGLSGSAPLKVAVAGAFGPAIDISQTLLSPLNLAVTLTLGVVITLLFRALGAGPEAGAAAPAPSSAAVSSKGTEREGESGASRRLERSWMVMAVLALPIVLALAGALWTHGTAAVNLESVILFFWVTGLVLHGHPMAYARAFVEGAAGAGGILLQFPLYFGVMAVMRDSGTLEWVANAFATLSQLAQGLVSAERTAAWSTFLSAAVLNLFVPSGGGQWSLQSPVILDLSERLALDRARLVMAFAYGDQLTNMLQPFWALPLLSITGLKAKDVMGYTLLAMLTALPIILLGLALL